MDYRAFVNEGLEGLCLSDLIMNARTVDHTANGRGIRFGYAGGRVWDLNTITRVLREA